MRDWAAYRDLALRYRKFLAGGMIAVLGLVAFKIIGGGVPDAPPATVLTQSITLSKSLTVDAVFSGVVQSERRTLLGFELPGTLDRVLVDVGATVDEGQVLASLRAEHLKAQEARILAELAQANASRNEAEARVTLAAKNADRKDQLLQSTFGSQQASDEARAELDAARARRDLATSDIGRAEATLDEVRVTLDRAVLHAPFSGTISDRYLDDGQVIDAGTPVLALVGQESLEARIGIADEAAPLLSPGNEYHLIVNNKAYTARLSGLADELDMHTRTRLARFVFTAEERPVVGSVARLSLEQTLPVEGAWVPLAALSRSARGLWRLYVVENTSDNTKVVRAQEVQIAHLAGDRAYVTGGISEGQAIVATGVHRIVPGQVVSSAPANT